MPGLGEAGELRPRPVPVAAAARVDAADARPHAADIAADAGAADTGAAHAPTADADSADARPTFACAHARYPDARPAHAAHASTAHAIPADPSAAHAGAHRSADAAPHTPREQGSAGARAMRRARNCRRRKGCRHGFWRRLLLRRHTLRYREVL